MAQLVQDLHAGKALITGKAEWRRQDILSLLPVFLTCSSLYMGWSKRRASRRDTASIAALSLQS